MGGGAAALLGSGQALALAVDVTSAYWACCLDVVSATASAVKTPLQGGTGS